VSINGTSERVNKPNVFFKNYRQLMNNFLDLKNVVTKYPIVSMCISYDSAVALTVTKANWYESWLKMYKLDT